MYHENVVDVHSLAHDCRRVFDILFNRISHKSSMHNFFDIFNENNVNIVIFITSQILATRHDSTKLKKWKKNQLIDDANKHQYDHIWERNLARKFQTMIIDETHIIKKISNDITIIIKWLMIDFLILMTRIFLFNDILDFKKFITLLEHFDVKKWWDSRELVRMNINFDFNFWYLFDDVRKLTHKTRCIEVDENINYAEVLVTCRQIFCQRSTLDLSLRRFTVSFYSNLTETRNQNHHTIFLFRLREASTSSFFLLLLLHACINSHNLFQSSF